MWYDSTVFWGVLGLVVSLLATLVGYLLTVSGRRLAWSASRAGRDGPRRVKITLASTGLSDIPSEVFDGGQPIRFDLGVRITELVSATSAAKTTSRTPPPVPPAVITGSVLEVGPGLIGRQQVLTYVVETDESAAFAYASCRAPLVDVHVKQESDAASAPFLGCGMIIAVGIALALTAAWAFGLPLQNSVVFLVVVIFAGIPAGAIMATWLDKRFRIIGR
jgi:hypothetical protein